MPYSESNASFQALRLLGVFFGKDADLLRTLWDSLRAMLAAENDTVRVRDDGWEQDWLLVKYGVERPAIATGAWYDPPADFHSFPTFDIDIHTAYLKDRAGITIRQTRSNADLAEIFSHTATTFAGPVVLGQLYELQSQIRAHGDPAMAQFNQALAWFFLGVGKVFGGIILTPDVEVPAAVSALAQRWQKILAEQDPYESIMNEPELMQWKLDVFYGAEMETQHGGIVFKPARQGQPKRWQEYWQWLGASIEPQRALEATRLAARLMICPPILLFLKGMLRGGPDVASDLDRLLALAILRRLTLQLQVMSWFEHALSSHTFAHARVEDLASFAFSALRPHWPRRLLALSHRSQDVKPALMKLQAWGNFRYSIDAMFPPHWETNVGMVWGLFSAVPGLIRIRSSSYDESVWCRREHEIFDYLCDEDDFLRGRHVIELNEADLPLLDAQIPPADPKAIAFVAPGSFPPLTSVFVVFPFEAWECRLLACTAVMRMIYSVVRTAAEAGVMCHLIAQGNLPQGLRLTNHPEGWAPITRLLHAFEQEWSDDPNVFPMAIDEQRYTQDDLARDIGLSDNIIDLSDGAIDQEAVLAALEWDRTIVPAVIGNGRYGQFFAVDYRRLTPELWRSDEHRVIRGVNRVRTRVPLWILQRAGQHVDEWPGVGTTPIFTQYADQQWHWMNELLDEPQWPETYRKESKLLFAPKLAAACAATATRDRSYYQGKVS